ncbi:MAG TPA: hypothetical protein PK440_12245 [Candidatus Accumulibacter phosphatis]|nr:hypothetical protein [Accumulibacter sp.]HCV14576.1 hypothetical protein [Accumulibacter sp.]HRL75653.1 hypothetical protein [Candidatus Accumulibacter phosphatis]HRQ95750.1 hypothetical protein [Candidatus Accumulibacter phosphatis]
MPSSPALLPRTGEGRFASRRRDFHINRAPRNDSFGNIGGSNATLGLFSNITVVDLASPRNGGDDTRQAYYNAGFGRPTRSMGDRDTTTDVINYLGNGDRPAAAAV